MKFINGVLLYNVSLNFFLILEYQCIIEMGF